MKKKILTGVALGAFAMSATGCGFLNHLKHVDWPDLTQTEEEKREIASNLLFDKYKVRSDFEESEEDLKTYVDNTIDALGKQDVYGADDIISAYSAHSDKTESAESLSNATVDTLNCMGYIDAYHVSDVIVDIVIYEDNHDAESLSKRVCEEFKDWDKSYHWF